VSVTKRERIRGKRETSGDEIVMLGSEGEVEYEVSRYWTTGIQRGGGVRRYHAFSTVEHVAALNSGYCGITTDSTPSPDISGSFVRAVIAGSKMNVRRNCWSTESFWYIKPINIIVLSSSLRMKWPNRIEQAQGKNTTYRSTAYIQPSNLRDGMI
jgi:hypothetical protein